MTASNMPRREKPTTANAGRPDARRLFLVHSADSTIEQMSLISATDATVRVVPKGHETWGMYSIPETKSHLQAMLAQHEAIRCMFEEAMRVEQQNLVKKMEQLEGGRDAPKGAHRPQLSSLPSLMRRVLGIALLLAVDIAFFCCLLKLQAVSNTGLMLAGLAVAAIVSGRLMSHLIRGFDQNVDRLMPSTMSPRLRPTVFNQKFAANSTSHQSR